MYFARRGPTKVFGRDVDNREAFSDSEALSRFDQVWANVLEPATRTGVPVEGESVLKKIKGSARIFFRREAAHREFIESGCLFIAQLTAENACDQLWFISSTSGDPRTLYVNFDTVEEREQFGSMASTLGWNDEDLGLQLARDFMRNVARHGRPAVLSQPQRPIDLTTDHHRWAEAAQRKYRKSKSYWLDLIVRQEGRCAFSGAGLKFDTPAGTPLVGGAGCHPLYASVDHCSPGSEEKGHQIVAYDLNDLKGHLPFECFEDLKATASWQRLMAKWRQQAEVDPESREAFLALRRGA